uniref:Uncharacterized protein LOC105643212 isoform X3 n=1 Tax=Rhizophora mucronata TaxID=61149 RepID=A0A2P2IMG6_RHIMU
MSLPFAGLSFCARKTRICTNTNTSHRTSHNQKSKKKTQKKNRIHVARHRSLQMPVDLFRIDSKNESRY